VVLAAGIASRLFVATLGHDYDFESWLINAKIPMWSNVYAATYRYNFAPAWFLILHVLYFLAGQDPAVFRYFVPGFLSLADTGIFFILWRKFGKLAGCWFFLNPISIMISGYQNNFDNVAIFTGLLAALLIKDEFEKPLDRQKIFGLALLGVSLVLKHVFFAFPFWLAVKQRGFGQKLLVVLIPVGIFFLSFVPYWPGGKNEIIQNVFLYRSYTTNFFYHMFLPQFVQYMFSSQAIWFFCMVIFAFIYRQKSTLETMFLYTCVMVATSPASINEYLAIPLCFVATNLNLFTILYTFLGSVHELVDYNGLRLAHIGTTYCLDLAVYTLFLALILVTWKQEITNMTQKIFKWGVFEVSNQFGLKK
jgi:hypothetical protein